MKALIITLLLVVTPIASARTLSQTLNCSGTLVDSDGRAAGRSSLTLVLQDFLNIEAQNITLSSSEFDGVAKISNLSDDGKTLTISGKAEDVTLKLYLNTEVITRLGTTALRMDTRQNGEFLFGSYTCSSSIR